MPTVKLPKTPKLNKRVKSAKGGTNKIRFPGFLQSQSQYGGLFKEMSLGIIACGTSEAK